MNHYNKYTYNNGRLSHVNSNCYSKDEEEDDSDNNEDNSDSNKKKSLKRKKSIWKDYHYTKKDNDILDKQIEKYRKNKEYSDNSNKRRKIITRSQSQKNKKEYSSEKMIGWVSGTHTKYYLLDDQCLDWLIRYYNTYGITLDEKESNKKNKESILNDASHINILFNAGNIFEKKIYDELKKIYKNDFVLVFDDDKMKYYRENNNIEEFIRKYNNNVKTLMNKGVPIIAQAPLINDNNKTYGIADILIRSDYLKKIFKVFVPDDEIYIAAPKLKMINGKSYHYRVIDCKWTTLPLCVDGKTIRKDGFFPAYKGQLAIYTSSLQNLQGYIPSYAYIIGKSWKINKKNIDNSERHLYSGYSAFDRPGIIDYKERDSFYVTETKKAIKWVQRVNTEGINWRYGPSKPTIKELYPNMNKSYNPVYDKVKTIIANRYGEATLLWNVSKENRNIGQKNGIYDIRKNNFNIKDLGIKDSKRGEVIDKIIKINKLNQNKNLILPKNIKNNMNGWQKYHDLDIYIDFETIGYGLYVDPNTINVNDAFYPEKDITYMIGLGFNYNPDINSDIIIKALEIDNMKCKSYINIDYINNWEYVCLYLSKFSVENEVEMLRLFFQFVIVRQELYRYLYDIKNNDLNTRLIHWTNAELKFVKNGINRIKSGKHTESYMGNKNMLFQYDNGKYVNKKEVQDELIDLVNIFEDSVLWTDLCKVFQEEPIVVKGTYRFKLKHIGRAFFNNGLIETLWKDEKMSDGFVAMLKAIEIYKNKNIFDDKNKECKSIINYNEIDCRVMWDIVKYLRENHCSVKN